MPSYPFPDSIFEIGGTHKFQSGFALRWRNTSGQTAGYLQLLLLTQRNFKLHLARLMVLYKMVYAAFFHESSSCQTFLYKATECVPPDRWPLGSKAVWREREWWRLGFGFGLTQQWKHWDLDGGFRETSKPHCIHSLLCLGNVSWFMYQLLLAGKCVGYCIQSLLRMHR